MSRREEKHHHLLGQPSRLVAEHDLDARLTSLLNAKMHGIAFSAYADGQQPGVNPSLTITAMTERAMSFIEDRAA